MALFKDRRSLLLMEPATAIQHYHRRFVKGVLLRRGYHHSPTANFERPFITCKNKYPYVRTTPGHPENARKRSKTPENVRKRTKNVRKSTVRKSAEKMPEVFATSRRSCGNAAAAAAAVAEKNGLK